MDVSSTSAFQSKNERRCLVIQIGFFINQSRSKADKGWSMRTVIRSHFSRSFSKSCSSSWFKIIFVLAWIA